MKDKNVACAAGEYLDREGPVDLGFLEPLAAAYDLDYPPIMTSVHMPLVREIAAKFKVSSIALENEIVRMKTQDGNSSV